MVRLKGKLQKPKFALQLYSRLTNANPELVLVFMQAGSKVIYIYIIYIYIYIYRERERERE